MSKSKYLTIVEARWHSMPCIRCLPLTLVLEVDWDVVVGLQTSSRYIITLRQPGACYLPFNKYCILPYYLYVTGISWSLLCYNMGVYVEMLVINCLLMNIICIKTNALMNFVLVTGFTNIQVTFTKIFRSRLSFSRICLPYAGIKLATRHPQWLSYLLVYSTLISLQLMFIGLIILRSIQFKYVFLLFAFCVEATSCYESGLVNLVIISITTNQYSK